MNICLVASEKPEETDMLLALGLGLQAYGHRSLIAAPAHFQPYLASYPLRYQAIAQPFEQEGYRSLIAACEQSDLLLVSPSYIFEAVTLSELLQKPFMFAATSPMLPGWRLPLGRMPEWASRLFAHSGERQRRSSMNAWRAAHGLRPVRGSLHRELARLQVPFLHAYSAALAPLPRRSDTRHHYISGAIAWNSHQGGYASWLTRESLHAWIEEGRNLVCFNLDRSAMWEVERMAALAAQAAQQLQLKVIIATDRYEGAIGGHAAHRSDAIRVVPSSGEYRWLHERCCCVVHGGDAATTHAVLAAGIPSIVLSADADQAFWGNQLAAHHAGKHIPLSEVTAAKLIQALQALMRDPAKARAARMGARMKQEGGLRGALDWIVRMMPSAPVFQVD